jgi:hypothetical protein
MAEGKDVFGYKRNRKVEGVFSTDGSWLHFGNMKSAQGYLVQSWQIAYNQDVVEVFELGSNALYWAKGRPTGAGSLSRIVGIKDASVGDGDTGLFPAEAYDICDGGALLEIKAAGGSCPPKGNLKDVGAKGITLSMDGCVITSIGFSANVGDTRLMEAVGWRFGFLEIKATQSGGAR